MCSFFFEHAPELKSNLENENQEQPVATVAKNP
jgi:hypothetical protein